jgi:hypothetical protein
MIKRIGAYFDLCISLHLTLRQYVTDSMEQSTSCETSTSSGVKTSTAYFDNRNFITSFTTTPTCPYPKTFHQETEIKLKFHLLLLIAAKYLVSHPDT